MKCSIVCALFASLAAVQAQGTFTYFEAVSGDLSGSFLAPTPISLSLGVNTVSAQMGNNGNTGATNGRDADYFRFDVGNGLFLSSVTIDSYTFSPGDPGVSFAAYKAGGAFTGQGAGDIDGQVLFNASSGEVLDDFAGGPLGAGTYAFWFQETSANIVDYQVSFVVVPEPSSSALILVGATSAWWLRRRR